MAKFELTNEQEHDEKHNQYLIKVTADLGEDQSSTHEQSVVLPKKDTDKAAQEYADQFETDLRTQAEADRKALAQADEAESEEPKK